MPSYTQYKRQVVFDDDNDIESWITVKGNHIPIRKGQSKEEAVKSFIEKKGGESGSVKESSPKKPKSSYAQVASLIKKDLASKGMKATATSHSYSGGNSVDVKVSGWYSPKIQSKIQEEYSKYQEGHVNPYEDYYEYSNVREDIPQTKYLFVDFEGPNEEDYKTAESYYKKHWVDRDVKEYENMSDWDKRRHLNMMFMNGGNSDKEKMLSDVKKWAKENNMPFSYQDDLPDSKGEIKIEEKKEAKSDSPMVNAVAKALNKPVDEAEEEIEGAVQYIKDLIKAKDLRSGDVEETLRGLGIESDYAEEFMQWVSYPSKKKKAPKVTYVDKKAWNSPASDPWKSLYDSADTKHKWSGKWKK